MELLWLRDSLRSFDLSKNAFKIVPILIPSFTQLKTLYLSNCGLQSISTDLRSLTNLQHLDLSCNDLEIDTLTLLPTSITKLNLSHNHFSAIPPILSSLIILTDLDLSYNRIENMLNIGQNTTLTILNLNNNMIVEVSLDAVYLKNLIKLSLCYNNISKNAVSYTGQSIPAEVFNIPTLDVIDLSGKIFIICIYKHV